jgi:FtsH-binding integral membrane protein
VEPRAARHRRAVTFLTFVAIVMVASNHLRFLATTPAETLWSLFGIALIVFGVLMWNVLLTRRRAGARTQPESVVSRLRTT